MLTRRAHSAGPIANDRVCAGDERTLVRNSGQVLEVCRSARHSTTSVFVCPQFLLLSPGGGIANALSQNVSSSYYISYSSFTNGIDSLDGRYVILGVGSGVVVFKYEGNCAAWPMGSRNQ